MKALARISTRAPLLEFRLPGLFQLNLTLRLSGFQLPFATLPSERLRVSAPFRPYHR